jgi:eukaryotic-like serine/threonine-protein kinase
MPRSDFPSQIMGLITMLFTDVVESSLTKRDSSLGRDNRERDHAYLAKVQTPHFELVRACCKSHGGREVSTMGDAFFLAFDDPAEAVRCAMLIQKRLTESPIETPKGPLRLRIGLHSGFPEFFEGSWHGTDVDTAARVEGAAAAKQILISARTYELTCDMTDTKFYPRGEFALKGVGELALWEVDWDGKGPSPPAPSPVKVQPKPPATIPWMYALAAAIIAVAAGYLIHSRHTPKPPADNGGAALAQPRQSVAVLGFKNLGSPNEEWLADALPVMLSTELAAGTQLRLISGEDVAKTTADLSLSRMPDYGRETLTKLHNILKSDYVVAGSYVAAGNLKSDTVNVDVHVQNASTGEMIASFPESGTIATLPDTLRKMAAALRAKLRIPEPSESETAQAQAALPADPEGTRLYSEGLAKLRTFDALGARDPLVRAIALQPNLAPAHAALASAWHLMGYDSKAREEAQKALELSKNLSQAEQRSIEGQYREFNSEWDKAIEIYRNLWGVFQDEPDYALKLANIQTAAGKGQDALATLDELRPPRVADDPRVDLARAFAAESLSDVKMQESASAAAAEKASKAGSRYLAAQAYWQQCSALFALGELQKALTACQKSAAAAPFASVIDARTKTVEARIMLAQDQPEEALEMHQQALESARKIGSQKDVIGALMNLAVLRATEGQTKVAEDNERQAIEIARVIGDRQQLVGLENDVASDFQTECEIQQAKGIYGDSLKTAQEIHDQNGIATALQNLGALSLQMGDPSTSEKEVQQGLRISSGAHLQSVTASGLNNLGDVEMVKGNLGEARKNYENASKLLSEAGDKPHMAINRLSLAKLIFEEGKFNDAELLARQAIQDFQTEKLTDDEADARGTLARILMAKGNTTAARAEIDAAVKIAVQDCVIAISLAVTAARLKARIGQPEEARKDLESQLTRAKEKGLVGLQFDLRLALAEIAVAGGTESSEASLQALKRDARASGYLLIANRADRLRTPKRLSGTMPEPAASKKP